MSMLKKLTLVGCLAVAFFATAGTPKEAEAGYRHYYSSWSYYPSSSYYYRTYYYRPVRTYSTYHYHYCIYYPRSPRYVYFYNPVRRVYWGRFDTQGKPGAQYSLLDVKDRKENLEEIPESAFPEPGAMPEIPDSNDGLQIPAIDDLPNLPADLPEDEDKE